MDFFAHQDKARKNTKVLVVYFVIAVACIIASVYVASLLIFRVTGTEDAPGEPTPELVLWDPKLFLHVVLGTLAVVIVAESLGGRLVSPDPSDPDERKLSNVVEEMAIAAGVPVPKIYVLPDEQGINAFAAGHTPEDAAIGVTRGCMTLLNRDELQGVIGHEFSHILNGDMRLNLRVMGVICSSATAWRNRSLGPWPPTQRWTNGSVPSIPHGMGSSNSSPSPRSHYERGNPGADKPAYAKVGRESYHRREIHPVCRSPRRLEFRRSR